MLCISHPVLKKRKHLTSASQKVNCTWGAASRYNGGVLFFITFCVYPHIDVELDCVEKLRADCDVAASFVIDS